MNRFLETSSPAAMLPEDLSQIAVLPQHRAYREQAATFFRGGAPAAILQARHAGHVRSAVRFAAERPELPFSRRSGGHGVSGRSTNRGGIVLDLAALNEITLLDRDTRLVRIGPGARWLDVARALHPYGLGISSGDHGGVGVGGLATSGGVGWFVRQLGLTIDHVRAVEIVLADGSLVRADATTEPDLFWAVRGAGASFGVVTAFEIEASPVSDVGYAEFVLVTDDGAQLLVDWAKALESASREVTSSIILGPAVAGRPAVARVNTVVHSDRVDEVPEQLVPFAALGRLVQQSTQVVPYFRVIDNVHRGPHRGVGDPHVRAGVVRHVTHELARGLLALLASGESHYLQIRALGGAVADVPADATAFAHRDANFLPGAIGRTRDGMNRAWDRLRPLLDGGYASFDTDGRRERLREAFPPPTLARLRGLKRRYDPHDVFRDNVHIDPAGAEESEPS